VTAVSVPRIEARIQTVRALRVMVDADLAEIHGVPTKRLNGAGQAKRRPVSGRLHVPAHRRGEGRGGRKLGKG